ncbi:MAG: DUF4142 domain-containing protein [Niabella sp.]
MKTLFITAIIFIIGISCNQKPRNPVAVADSINEAKQGQAALNETVTADSISAAFLVRAITTGMKETELARIEGSNGNIPSVKNFAVTIQTGFNALNESIRQLAIQKNITLPDSNSAATQKEINRLSDQKGSQLDKQFIKEVIGDHKTSVEYYEAAAKNAGDTDVRAFADKNLPALQANLDSAKSILKKYW